MSTAKPIESAADFESAISEPTKHVFIYVHEGPIPEDVKQRFQENAPKFADKVEHYKLDIAANPAEAREKMALKEVPALLVFKGGKEVERLEGLDGEGAEKKMEEVVGRLFG